MNFFRHRYNTTPFNTMNNIPPVSSSNSHGHSSHAPSSHTPEYQMKGLGAPVDVYHDVYNSFGGNGTPHTSLFGAASVRRIGEGFLYHEHSELQKLINDHTDEMVKGYGARVGKYNEGIELANNNLMAMYGGKG